MNKTVFLALFVCLAVVQIAVPASMIHKWESTLRDGRRYRFQTAPVDPYDAFRGRYVMLQLKSNSAPAPESDLILPGQKVYAVVQQGADGFARIAEVSRGRPQSGDYVRATVMHGDRKTIILNLPFDRYYMEETLAPKAEDAYRRHSRRGQEDAFIAVRIKFGVGVIEELYINGKPIVEFLRQEG